MHVQSVDALTHALIQLASSIAHAVHATIWFNVDQSKAYCEPASTCTRACHTTTLK